MLLQVINEVQLTRELQLYY